MHAAAGYLDLQELAAGKRPFGPEPGDPVYLGRLPVGASPPQAVLVAAAHQHAFTAAHSLGQQLFGNALLESNQGVATALGGLAGNRAV